MKTILVPIAVLVAGVGVGGGAAFATAMLTGGGSEAGTSAPKAEDTAFVPASKVLAPLVMADGRLAGYVSFDIQLEVAADRAGETTAKLPLLLNAINMRTYRTPMAAGPDGLLPELGTFRKVVAAAAVEAFGPKVVRQVAITQAEPA